MLLNKLRMPIHDLRRGFADDDEAHDDRPLRPLVGDEIFFAHTLDEATRLDSRLSHMLDVIAQSVLSHTGRAVAST